MWYFLIRQNTLETAQYLALQKLASLTEVEAFSDPYESWYVFTVEKADYHSFMDHLDQAGIMYDLKAERPTRSDLLISMR